MKFDFKKNTERPKRIVLSCDMTPEFLARIDKIVEREGETRAHIVRVLLASAVEEYERISSQDIGGAN